MNQIVLYQIYGNTTLSDLEFMRRDPIYFPSTSSTSNSYSTASDKQSASPDFEKFFSKVCDEYTRCVHEFGRVLPPEWTMPELVQTVLGDDVIHHSFLTGAYYNVILCGTHCWGCEELLKFLDLINCVF
ncbi:hypothetical protein FXO38_08028 [Capsicum annuum]|uniref:Uncharacterized protein n=1 Tax=Capsicum annuum TaxID=4072 RepID=A0A2G2ZHY7_CAPAN|nr:hypothetical protein FXO37_17480 [Capsicum annuum]KAF3668517.1 hypothetical protein FXO38_08028 [Capsicum annuum]PHT81545.1 hypothetical protein T459_14560 [Capsicum annuum]